MRSGHWVSLALVFALALALGSCGDDDDDATGAETDPFGNAGGRSVTGGSGGSRSFAGAGGGAGATGMDAGANAGTAGMMMDPMMDPMKMPKPMEMCPAAMPVEGSPCMGRRMCTFGDVECRCQKEKWSCEMADPMSEDGGMMMP